MEFKDIAITVMATASVLIGLFLLYVWYVIARFRGQLNQLLREAVEQVEANMVGVDIELDQGTYFCYNSTDRQFICQGQTVDEIRQAFRSRYPDKTAYLAGGTPEVVEQFKTELLRSKANETSTGQ